ncbi:MAG: helix-turn-helix domain-containing protein [Deltaproteobacteria bacterium]|nr:helix-turn-helix domain-containing protein [Deltaproteobacteria bacterium]
MGSDLKIGHSVPGVSTKSPENVESLAIAYRATALKHAVTIKEGYKTVVAGCEEKWVRQVGPLWAGPMFALCVPGRMAKAFLHSALTLPRRISDVAGQLSSDNPQEIGAGLAGLIFLDIEFAGYAGMIKGANHVSLPTTPYFPRVVMSGNGELALAAGRTAIPGILGAAVQWGPPTAATTGSGQPAKRIHSQKVDEDTLSKALEETVGHQKAAAKKVGLSTSAVNHRIAKAPEGSLLHKFKEIKGKRGRAQKVDDATLAIALNETGGNQAAAAKKVGLTRAAVSVRIVRAPEGSLFHRFKGGSRPKVDDSTLAKALHEAGGNQSAAARKVGLSRVAVNKRIAGAQEGSPIKLNWFDWEPSFPK